MSRPGARVAVAIASLAAIVWLVVALVVITDHGNGGTADTLAPVTAAATTTGSTSPGSTTSLPSTAASATTAASTTVAASTSVPTPLLIDLAVPAPAMKPQVLATFPIVNPNDPRRGYALTTDHHKRVVVLDLISADVSFADLATGVWTTYPSDVPIADLAGYFVIGPDDVIYMQLVDANSIPGGVAYAMRDGRYVEVARFPSGIGDSDVVAGRTGPGVIGVQPLTAYVGADGAPSGAVLADHDFGQINITPTHLTLSRGARAWEVDVAHNGCLESMCTSVGLAPGDDALVFNQLGNSPKSRVTWLSDTSRSWDTEWRVVGPVDAGLVVANWSGDQLEIGLVK